MKLFDVSSVKKHAVDWFLAVYDGRQSNPKRPTTAIINASKLFVADDVYYLLIDMQRTPSNETYT